jgi:hypothetical protein
VLRVGYTNGYANLSGNDADVVILLLNLMRLVGLDIDLGADRGVDDGRDVDETAALLGEDLELGNDIRHGC